MISGRLEFMKDSAKMSSLKMFLFISSTVTPRLCTYSLSSCGMTVREREVRGGKYLFDKRYMRIIISN